MLQNTIMTPWRPVSLFVTNVIEAVCSILATNVYLHPKQLSSYNSEIAQKRS